jgi:hypothetical protein
LLKGNFTHYFLLFSPAGARLQMLKSLTAVTRALKLYKRVYPGAPTSTFSNTFSTVSSEAGAIFPPYHLPTGLVSTEKTLSSLPEVEQADVFVKQGKFTAAQEALERSLSICTYIPDPLVSIAVRIRMAKTCFFSGNQAREEQERASVYKDLLALGDKADADLCAESTIAYIVCLLRGGKTDLALSVTNDRLGHTECRKAAFLLQAAYCGLLNKDAEAVTKINAALLLEDIHPSLSGDVLLVQGDWHRYISQDAEAATASYQAALEHFEGQDVIGEVSALLKLGNWESVQQALSVAEAEWGQGHPLVADCLRVLAGLAQERGEAVTSEGLFRGCLTKLDALESVSDPVTPPTQFSQALLMHARADYARLLCHVEWNGGVRCREAALLLDKNMKFGVKFSHVSESALTEAKEGNAGPLVADLEMRPPVVDWWVTLKYGL